MRINKKVTKIVEEEVECLVCDACGAESETEDDRGVSAWACARWGMSGVWHRRDICKACVEETIARHKKDKGDERL